MGKVLWTSAMKPWPRGPAVSFERNCDDAGIVDCVVDRCSHGRGRDRYSRGIPPRATSITSRFPLPARALRTLAFWAALVVVVVLFAIVMLSGCL